MRKGQSHKFKTHFDKFVCEGDTITAELPGGFTAHATIVRDDCRDRPDERQDGFWPSRDPNAAGYVGEVSKRKFDRLMGQARTTLEEWERGEWWYCGVCVVISKDDVQLTGRYNHALWGVDCNYPFPGRYRPNYYLRDVANELLSEALSAARNTLDKLAA